MDKQALILNEGKFGYIDVATLSPKQLEIALIQGTQLLEWRDKLVASLYCDLREILNKRNCSLTFEYGKTFDPFTITRGTDMDNFVGNWSPIKKIKTYLD